VADSAEIDLAAEASVVLAAVQARAATVSAVVADSAVAVDLVAAQQGDEVARRVWAVVPLVDSAGALDLVVEPWVVAAARQVWVAVPQARRQAVVNSTASWVCRRTGECTTSVRRMWATISTSTTVQ
jgi:hypothetical protein